MLFFAGLVCTLVGAHGVAATSKELPLRERVWVIACGAAGTAGVARAFARVCGWL